MKFYCDVCNTKYSIADEKVRGKVLKVRCKKCSNIITVREAVAPAQSVVKSAAPAPAAVKAKARKPEVPKTNWYFSVNGQSSGPMSLADLEHKFRLGVVGDEAYVWHESLVEWKPVRDVPTFANALDAGHEVKPRSKTLGFTGKIEAIKAVDGVNRASEGAVPAGFGAASSTAAPGPAAHEEKPEPAVRQEKLDKLRDKLRVKPESSLPSREKLDPIGLKLDESIPEEMHTADIEREEPADVGAPVSSSLSFAPGVMASAPLGQTDVPRSESALDLPAFDLPPAGNAPRVDTSSTSDILDESLNPLPHGLGDDDDDFGLSADDSGVIPFFPEAPKLESSHAPAVTQSQVTTGSLLIQIEEMKREGRGKTLLKFGVLIGLLTAVASIAVTTAVMNQEGDKDVVAEAKPKIKQRTELKERTYSKSKLNAFSNLTLEDDVIGTDESVEDLEFGEDEVEAIAARPAEKVEPAEKSVVPTKSADVEKKKVAARTAKTVKTEEPETTGVASAASAKPEEPARELTAREKLLQYGRASGGVTPSIKRPEDTLGQSGGLPKVLSKDDARKGFKRIRQSVMLCRERHTRRGGKFDDKKIKLSVVVNPDGRVSKLSTNSAGLTGTEFENCMNSHRGRWRFAKWEGEPTEINSSFILQ